MEKKEDYAIRLRRNNIVKSISRRIFDWQESSILEKACQDSRKFRTEYNRISKLKDKDYSSYLKKMDRLMEDYEIELNPFCGEFI
jgi:hypothetical protein